MAWTIADPANRDIWSGASSAWSYVFVPGPAADFMADDPSTPHGAWSTVRYFSNLTHTERQMQIYTPPGYNRSHREYPVLYLMHGGGGNDTDWIVNMRANYIMDNLIAQLESQADDCRDAGWQCPIIVQLQLFGATGHYSPEELVGSILPYIQKNYRAAPGARNRAMAGLSLGGLWTLDTLLQDPGTFVTWACSALDGSQRPAMNLVQNHADLLTNPAINKHTKLLWITVGDPRDIAYNNNFATLALFERIHIRYRFVQGTGGHVWDTWRHDLLSFAPLLFR